MLIINELGKTSVLGVALTTTLGIVSINFQRLHLSDLENKYPFTILKQTSWPGHRHNKLNVSSICFCFFFTDNWILSLALIYILYSKCMTFCSFLLYKTLKKIVVVRTSAFTDCILKATLPVMFPA